MERGWLPRRTILAIWLAGDKVGEVELAPPQPVRYRAIHLHRVG